MPVPFAWFGIQPIVYFYVAIVVECTLFAIGLSKQIRDHLRERRRLEALFRETEREMEIKILRGQLNSHFIFNVLNSIKVFIIENEADESVAYLGKFSTFMRSILESSRKENSTLKEELRTILLYADIENIRLSKAVAITCKVDADVKLEEVRLPTMVLQPFVENAIWHGLSKVENRQKMLDIRIFTQHNTVVVSIEDNGVGYSSENTRPTRVFEKSYGLRIVKEQVERFNAKHRQHLHFEILTRTGEGTRVVFIIPHS